MINKFYFIGFGSIAQSLLEVFNIEKAFYNIPITIIEPKELKHKDLFENRNVLHIKKAITKNNHKRLLNGIDNETLIIDLSVNVDSIMLLKFCKDRGTYYINTSIENYEFPTHNQNEFTYNSIKDNTLYHRELIARDILKNTKKARFLNVGFNPGCIQAFFKRGIKEYAKLKGKKLIAGNYGKLANELGLEEIIIAEFDSQKTNIKPTNSKFINTWSCVGFQEEAGDNVMLSVNNETKQGLAADNVKFVSPNDGNCEDNIIFLPEKGMNVKRQAIYLDNHGNPHQYEGMLIPHAEISSMCEFLHYNGNSPNIMYVYRPCNASIASLDNFKNNKYNVLPDYYVIEKDDVIEGFDSIGALMYFKNGEKYWCGSVVDITDVRRLGFKYSNPTSIQVSGFLFACIKYLMKHPNEGYNESETLPHKELFKYCEKYMGNIFSKLIE